MTMLFNVFGKKLFGVRYERLLKNLLLCVIVYLGLSSMEYTLNISPKILCLMSAVVAGTMMWQALTSSDTSAYIRNLVMMPFENRDLVSAYTVSLALYTFVIKVGLLWALVFAVARFSVLEIISAFFAACCGMALVSCFFAFKRSGIVTVICAGATAACIFLFGGVHPGIMSAVFVAEVIVILIFLTRADGYAIYDALCDNEARSASVKSRSHCLVFTYFMRYMTSHKNYIFNTILTWALAAFIPVFFKLSGAGGDLGKVILYIGFGIATVNTPLCILVSCDPDLGRGIDTLPDGGKRFFLPYGAFLFVSTGIAYAFYLTSWNITAGGIGVRHIVLAVILALVSAALSVGAEMFFPLKNWKIESDLWHHPRKYAVPGAIIILASLAGTIIA